LPEFREPVLSGRKTFTARLKKYGDAGDVFETPWGARVVLLDVRQLPLGFVAQRWAEEGARSREHFIETWERCYPEEAPFDPRRIVWMHRFRLQEESEKVNA